MKNLKEMTREKILVSPSILSADFSALGQDIIDIDKAGADMIHVDIMDGHFVPNISFGPGVTGSIRHLTDLLFDVHLMLSNPEDYLEAFVKAGAGHITIHEESNGDTAGTLAKIHALGCTAGLTLRPGTPVEAVLPYLSQVEMVLVMTVEPGFGGQSFMHDQLPKISCLRNEISRLGKKIYLEVDGGITPETAVLACRAGADILVAGSSVFKHRGDFASAIAALKNCR